MFVDVVGGVGGQHPSQVERGQRARPHAPKEQLQPGGTEQVVGQVERVNGAG